MNEVLGKGSKREVGNLLQDGVVELRGSRGRPVRFGFMAAMEHEGKLYIVLTKLTRKQQLSHELLLLHLLRAENGALEDYEVVYDPVQATTLIDRYIHVAVEALFEGDFLEEGDFSEEEGWMEEDEAEPQVLH